VRKQVSCQDFVITIREGRHQFPWHKKQEHSRIFPSDTVVVLTFARPPQPPDRHRLYRKQHLDRAALINASAGAAEATPLGQPHVGLFAPMHMHLTLHALKGELPAHSPTPLAYGCHSRRMIHGEQNVSIAVANDDVGWPC
jgi:hypothetical protein